VSGSETAALTSLINLYEKDNPGATVINAAVTGTANAQMELQQRMTQGLPPDTFQVNGGDDLLGWVKYNGKDDSASKLEPIESLGNTQQWLGVTPKAVSDLVTYNGHVYGVPVDVSRTNCLFYNKAIFAANNLTPPTTLDEFFTVADALQAQGITPLAVGSQQPWTLGTLVWENVLVASAGSQYYLDFFAGLKSADDPELRTALEAAAKMLGYANPDHDSLLWNDAVGLVAQGKAAMNIMGDWAKGELINDHAVPNKDFGESNLGAGIFVFAVDAFPLPKGAPNRDGAISLLTTMGSLPGQNAFNPVKGSISPRTDVDATLYDPISQQTIADFKTNTLVPANSAIVPSSFSNSTNPALGTFINDKNVDNLILTIKNYYDELKVN
jgi:glucose/mannose transport system substrate-binding protein